MSIVGACKAPIDSILPFTMLTINFDLSGTQTTGSHPNQQTATFSLEAGAFTYIFSPRQRWFGNFTAIDVDSDSFVVGQSECCCQCQWSVFLKDSGYTDTTASLFQRGIVPGIITQSNPRVKIVTTFENGSPTVTSFSNLDITVFPYDNSGTGPCNRYPNGDEPDYGTAATSISFADDRGIGGGSGTTITETTNSCGDISTVTRTGAELLAFGVGVPMQTCKTSQNYSFKKELTNTGLSAMAELSWEIA